MIVACGTQAHGVGAEADENGDRESNGRDAGRPLDARAGDGAAGLARASFLDARPNDFESIPEQTEMNLGPGARPSDYPEAAEWQDPAPPQGCCTPVSAAIKLDTEEWGSGPAAMAWADGVFGISWPSEGSSGFIEGNLRFRTVDPKNLLVSALEEPVEAQAKWGYTPSLAWANDRFALAYLSQGEHGRQAVFAAILNEHGYAPWLA